MTQLLVLGLLKEKPLSGYDIQLALQVSDAESWGGVLVGSIYHALKKLEKDGHIEIASLEQTGNRQKAVYQITDTGVEHLYKLIADVLQSSSVVLPTAFYSGLNFMDLIPKEQRIVALKLQKMVLKKEYDNLRHGLEKKKTAMDNTLPTISELVFDHMFATIQQQYEFVNQLLKLLET